MRILPLLGINRPEIKSIKVLLPSPDFPDIPIISPLLKLKFTLLKISFLPLGYLKLTFLNFILDCKIYFIYI